MEFVAKGKRSLVYRHGEYAIKIISQEFLPYHLYNEAKWLQILNKNGIGPKLYDVANGCLVMEFVEGTQLVTLIPVLKKEQRQFFARELLRQAYCLDKHRVNKYEFHKPFKHALVHGNALVLIDFERCKEVQRPKNVTQACHFIARYYNCPGILEAAQKYKQTYDESMFMEILKWTTSIG